MRQYYENFEDFEEFYQKLNKDKVKEQWDEAMAERKRNRIFVIIILLIIDALLIYSFHGYGAEGYQLFLFSLVACVFLDLVIYGIFNLFLTKNKKKYKEVFKKEIVNSILSNFFDEVVYIPESKMPISTYREGGYESFDIYKSDDYMEAKIDGNYSIQMGDILTQDEDTSIDSNGNTTTTTTTVFSGIFAKVDLKKSIISELRISGNRSISRKKRLEMDSSEFEEFFDVSSSNNIIGMQLLTHDIMEKLVELRGIIGKEYDIFIRNNIMYIRSHCGPVFETNFKKDKPVDKDVVKKFYKIVKFIYLLSKCMIKVVDETKI